MWSALWKPSHKEIFIYFEEISKNRTLVKSKGYFTVEMIGNKAHVQ